MDPEIRMVVDAQTRMLDDTTHEVEARACAYGVPDSYSTSWSKGWAAGSLRGIDDGTTTVPVVFGHDERTLGNVIGSVVGSRDEDDGLYLRMRFADFDAVPAAKAAYSLLKDKHISGWSYKFRDGTTVVDPDHAGVRKFTSGRLVHVSPVIDASIPGTATVSVRDANGVEAGVSTVEDAAQLLATGIRSALEAGHRSLTITVGDDGKVTTDGGGSGDTSDTTDQVATLAQAIDGAVDAAIDLLESLDQATLDPAVAQALQLVTAADVASDELLEMLGLPDPDENLDDEASGRSADDLATPEDGMTEDERAAASPSDFADPGYQKDKKPRYPLRNAKEVRAAWSYVNMPKNAAFYSADQLASIKAKIKAAAKRTGVEIADSGKRSADEIDLDVQLALAGIRRH